MPGRLKIQGRSLKFVDANGQVWQFDESASDTTSHGPLDPGSLSVRGDYLVFVTAGGQRRYIREFQIVTPNSPDPPGAIRIKGSGELLYTTINGRQHRAHYDNSYSDEGYDDWGSHTDRNHLDDPNGFYNPSYGDYEHTDYEDSIMPHTDEGYIDNEPYDYDDSQPYPSTW